MSYKQPKLINLKEVESIGNCAAGFNEDSIYCFDGAAE